jgi:hypothetical protein
MSELVGVGLFYAAFIAVISEKGAKCFSVQFLAGRLTSQNDEKIVYAVFWTFHVQIFFKGAHYLKAEGDDSLFSSLAMDPHGGADFQRDHICRFAEPSGATVAEPIPAIL